MCWSEGRNLQNQSYFLCGIDNWPGSCGIQILRHDQIEIHIFGARELLSDLFVWQAKQQVLMPQTPFVCNDFVWLVKITWKAFNFICFMECFVWGFSAPGLNKNSQDSEQLSHVRRKTPRSKPLNLKFQRSMIRTPRHGKWVEGPEGGRFWCG